MSISKEDIRRIKNKSKRLNKARKILKSEYEDKELIPIITKNQPKIGTLSEGYFSKYKNVETKDEYLDQINELTMDRIIKALDSLIKDDHNLYWNEVKKKYETISESTSEGMVVKERINKEDEKKLAGLQGTWKSFSWNRKRTDRDKIGHVNVCRVKIFEDRRIIYITEKANFKGIVKPIGNNKISIELTAENRSAYLFGKIGVRDDLQRIQIINLAYTDSGNDEIRCGLTVLQRTKDKFETIETKSFPIDSVPPCSEDIIKVLRDTQFRAKMHDD